MSKPLFSVHYLPLVLLIYSISNYATEMNLNDLETAMKILPAADLKTLAKSYHMNPASQIKETIVAELMKRSRQNTIGSMFKIAGDDGNRTMLARYTLSHINQKNIVLGISRFNITDFTVMFLTSLVHWSFGPVDINVSMDRTIFYQTEHTFKNTK